MRSFKKGIFTAAALAVIVLLNSFFNFAIIPYSYVRVSMHEMMTGKYETVYFGTSHGLCGIDPVTVERQTKQKGINMCFGGEYTRDVYYLLKSALLKGKPKQIVYELDPGYWVNKENEKGDFARLFWEMPMSSVKLEYFADKMLNADFRTVLCPWFDYRSQAANALSTIKTKLSKEYREYGTSTFQNAFQRYCEGGFIDKQRVQMKKAPSPPLKWDKSSIQKEAVQYFEKIVKLCREKDIKLTVITTPIPESTQKAEGREYGQANRFLDKYMKKQGVTYYNFNYMPESGADRKPENFFDAEGHMYGDTARKFSEILGKYLKES